VGFGALNMLVNSPGPDACEDAAGAAGIAGSVGAACSGFDALNMLVNSPGPDACEDVAGAAGVAGSAEGAGGGALNILVNSPGGVDAGGIADRIAKVPAGVAGSSGKAGENAPGIAWVVDATGGDGCGFFPGEDMGILTVSSSRETSAAGGVPCAYDGGTGAACGA